MDISTAFISVQQLGLIPVVIGLVSLAKSVEVAGKNNRWAPLMALCLGVAGAFIIPSVTVQFTILAGIIIGLAAAGFYSGAKATVQG